METPLYAYTLDKVVPLIVTEDNILSSAQT